MLSCNNTLVPSAVRLFLRLSDEWTSLLEGADQELLKAVATSITEQLLLNESRLSPENETDAIRCIALISSVDPALRQHIMQYLIDKNITVTALLMVPHEDNDGADPTP